MATPEYDIHVYIDTDNDGDFSEPEEDVTAYFLEASGSRGRSSVNDEYAPSKATVVLLNNSGELSLFNASGTYYEKIVTRRAISLTIDVNGNTYPVFFGFISSIKEKREVQAMNRLEIQAMGIFDIWRLGNVRIDLLEDNRTDELIDAVLDAFNMWGAPWPASLRDLDVGYETIPQFWQHRAKPIDALREAARQDLDGHLFDGKDGAVIWRNRWWRAVVPLAATISPSGDLQGRAFDIEVSAEDLIDRAEFTRAGLDVDSNVTILYTLSPVGRAFQPGAEASVNTLNGQYTVGGKNVVEPVQVTDFTFNSAADGSGTDKTAQVVVDSFTSFGGGFSVRFDVLDSSQVFITFFQVRGQAVRRSNDERRIEVEASNPSGSEQVLEREFNFNDNIEDIGAMARLKAEVLSRQQPQPPITITPGDLTQLELAVQLDIGSRVRLIDTTGAQKSEIDAEFFIEMYAWKYAPKRLAQYTFQLWHEDKAHGNLFVVSPDAPDAIISPIAGDSDTVFDRIGV